MMNDLLTHAEEMIAGLAGLAILVVWGFFTGREKGERKAEVAAQKAQDDAQNAPVQAAITNLEQKVSDDDKAIESADARLARDLASRASFPAGGRSPGSGTGSD